MVSKITIPPHLSGDVTVMFLFLAKFARTEMYAFDKFYWRGAYDKFPDFFPIGSFIDSTRMRL